MLLVDEGVGWKVGEVVVVARARRHGRQTEGECGLGRARRPRRCFVSVVDGRWCWREISYRAAVVMLVLSSSMCLHWKRSSHLKFQCGNSTV